MNLRTSKITIISAIIAVGLLVRVLFALVIKPVHGDMAVFAIMAKHIFELKELPIYMPLAHYAGSLSSYIGAAIFALFGVSYNSYIVVGVMLSCAWLVLGCFISRKLLEGFGVLTSCLLIAVPTLLVLEYSLFTGVHGENFLFIPILLLLAIKINREEYADKKRILFISGLVSGIALWATPAAIPAMLTLITIFLLKEKGVLPLRPAILFVMGFAAGHLPAIIYNYQHPAATLFRMGGRVLGLDKAALSDPHLLSLISSKIAWRLSTIPESLTSIPLLTAELISFPVVALLFISIAVSLVNSAREFSRSREINGIGIILIYVLWFALFYAVLVGERAGRYMVPLCIAAPFLIGNTISLIKKGRKAVFICIITPLLLYNIWTIINQPNIFVVGRYAKIAEWLVSNNVKYGYSDYETAYMVQFISGEKVLISPTLFHPVFSDRYPEYTEKVRSSGEACYIVDIRLHPKAAAEFERSLARLDQLYKKEQIGDFIIYRGLSSALQPKDIIPISIK